MKHCVLLLSILLASWSLHAQTLDTLTVMTYNLLNFPNGRNDCGTNTVIPARWDTLTKIIDHTTPDILMVCELQNASGADAILNNALNVNGRTGYQRAAFVLNNSSGVIDLNNMLFYNSQKVGLKHQDEIETTLRDVGVYQLYAKNPNGSSDTVFFDVMVAHLKAGSGTTNEDRREQECDSIRKYIDTASTARNIILGGDFNVYSSTEGGFQRLLSGTYPLNDPINITGNWNNNFAYAPVHTQSTRSSVRMDCGALGGMDSRFDFLMVSNPVLVGNKNVRYLPNSYTVLGNNGSTYNDPINDPANTSTIPTDVLNALHSMSDHLPVFMQIEITQPNNTLLYNQLESFKSKATWDYNQLNWLFSQPEFIETLIVETSTDGFTFDVLSDLTVQQTTFKHQISMPQDYYYRLKWISNGQVFYSNIIFVENKQHAPNISLYPNPTHQYFNIKITDDISYQNTEINIYDALGQHCYQSQHNFSTMPLLTVYLNSLEHGIYTIRIKNRYYSVHERIVVR